MKFLSMSFREAMSDFFGKAGMPWHGVMFIRRAHGEEKATEGEYIVTYVDGMMADKKEDGFATLSAVYLALKHYKEEHPWITHAAVKTDGAGAYAGVVFTVGMSMMGDLTGVTVTDHYIGESGKGKSQLDGHFGVKGAKVRRLVAAAMHDILTPEKLYRGVQMTLGRNESAMLFQPDRSQGSSLDAASIKQLSAMSHREYVFKDAGEFSELVLRQQTRLGDGLRVAAKALRQSEKAVSFALPRLVESSGAPAVAGEASTAAAAAEAAREAGSSGARGGHSALPVARDKAGRERAEAVVSQRRKSREERKKQDLLVERAAVVERCQQSVGFWCRCDPEGHPRCNFTSSSLRGLQLHLRAGVHNEGLIRPYRSGVAADRPTARDRDVSLVANALTAVIDSSAASAACQAPQLQPAGDFRLRYSDGTEYVQAPQPLGWARAQRLPTERCSVEQLEFVYNAYFIGETFSNVKFSAAQARDLMLVVGTAATAAQYAGHPYFGVDHGRPRFRRTEALDESKLKSYFGRGGQLKRLLENARRRGAVADDASDGDGSDGEPRQKKRRRRRSSGGGGGGGGGGGAKGAVWVAGGASISKSTLIAELNSTLIKGFGPKSVAAWTAKAQTAAADAVPKTCGALAALSSEGLSALAKLKIRGVGAKTLCSLHSALVAHFAAASSGGQGGELGDSSSADSAGSGSGGGGSGDGGGGGDGGGDGGTGGGGGSGGGEGDGVSGSTPVGSLTLDQLPSMPTHGFQGKLALVAAKWETCELLVAADRVDASRPKGVGKEWLERLQTLVRSQIAVAAPSGSSVVLDEAGAGAEGADGSGGSDASVCDGSSESGDSSSSASSEDARELGSAAGTEDSGSDVSEQSADESEHARVGAGKRPRE